MKIKSKREFYELYRKGAFGNKALSWNSVEELKRSKYAGPVCIRGGISISREKVGYDIKMPMLDKVLEEYSKKGIEIRNLRFNQSMPDDKLILQGELMRSQRYLDLTYTTIKKPMNVALREEERHAEGISALMIIKSSLWPSSLSDMEVLLSLFPDSVIEFSCYSCAVGDTPNRNTVIWEVRNY